MSKADEAAALFAESHNCSQSVFTPFATAFGVDQSAAKSIAAAFGGGMGHTQATCGAVTGALMAIGLAEFDPQDIVESKNTVYDLAARFMADFAGRHGSVVCRDLLGADMHTAEGRRTIAEGDLYRTRCAPLVRAAAALVEEMIGRNRGEVGGKA
jgi:C_GCAxxG_C_C family probable redox protein